MFMAASSRESSRRGESMRHSRYCIGINRSRHGFRQVLESGSPLPLCPGPLRAPISLFGNPAHFALAAVWILAVAFFGPDSFAASAPLTPAQTQFFESR